MTTQSAKEVMSRAETAKYIGVGKSTLDKLDIPKVQIRRRVLYRKDAVDRWLEKNQGKEAQA
jgi:excisionase family DNA binding protein